MHTVVLLCFLIGRVQHTLWSTSIGDPGLTQPMRLDTTVCTATAEGLMNAKQCVHGCLCPYLCGHLSSKQFQAPLPSFHITTGIPNRLAAVGRAASKSLTMARGYLHAQEIHNGCRGEVDLEGGWGGWVRVWVLVFHVGDACSVSVSTACRPGKPLGPESAQQCMCRCMLASALSTAPKAPLYTSCPEPGCMQGRQLPSLSGHFLLKKVSWRRRSEVWTLPGAQHSPLLEPVNCLATSAAAVALLCCWAIVQARNLGGCLQDCMHAGVRYCVRVCCSRNTIQQALYPSKLPKGTA
jgi:hypothetical protein